MQLLQIKISDDIDLVVELANGKLRVIEEGAPKPLLDKLKEKIPGKIDDAIIDVIEKWIDSQTSLPVGPNQ